MYIMSVRVRVCLFVVQIESFAAIANARIFIRIHRKCYTKTKNEKKRPKTRPHIQSRLCISRMVVCGVCVYFEMAKATTEAKCPDIKTKVYP